MSLVDIVRYPIRNRTRGTILLAALVAAHVASVPAFVFVTRVGRPRYFGFFVVIALAILLLDVLVALSSGNREGGIRYPSIAGDALDHRVMMIVLLVAVSTFVTVGLGFFVYLVMAIFFSMLVVRAFAVDSTEGERYVSLALIVLGSFFLMVAQVASVPLFFRTSDTLGHLTLSLRIADTGFVERASPGRYGDLPAFHVFMASMTQVADRTSRLYFGLVIAGLFQLTLPAFYVMLRKFRQPVGVSIAGTVLLAVAPSFLVWGTQIHAQSFSFFFLAIFLSLLVSLYDDRRSVLVSVVIVIAWVLTHQLTVLMAISLIGVPTTALYLYTTVRRSPVEKEIRSAWYRFSILVVVLVTHWTIVTQIMREPLAWIFASSPAAQGVPSRAFLINVYDEFDSLVVASIPEILDKVHYTVWLAAAALGVWAVARAGRTDRYHAVALLSFLPAAVFYFPNPAWLPLQGVAIIGRWGLIALPFIVLLPALGLRHLLGRYPGGVRTVAVAVFVVSLVFLSIGSGMSDPSVTDLAGYNKETPKYLSATDLTATSYVFAYTDNTSTFGTSGIPHYLSRFDAKYRRVPGATSTVSADLSRGIITFHPGLNVIQTERMNDDLVKVVVSVEPTIFTPVSSRDVRIEPEQGSRVYDADTTEIYYSTERRAQAGTEGEPG